MEIIASKNRQQLLDYLPQVKGSLKDWLIVDVRLQDAFAQTLSIDAVAGIVCASVADQEGRLLVCNDRQIVMLLRLGTGFFLTGVVTDIERNLPQGSCEVTAQPSTVAGLAKFEIIIARKKPFDTPDLYLERHEKIVMIADDDMYIRLLVKKSVGPQFSIHEVAAGDKVLENYRTYMPDILFLDIHLPGMDGTDILREIMAIDPKAYIVMLSADSSRENVELTSKGGAKGFLTKPFTREKIQEYIRSCPTLSA